MHGLALWMPSAAEHGMNIQLTSLGLCLMNQLCWVLYHGLNDLIVLGMIVDSVLSKSGESDFFFFVQSCTRLHIKVGMSVILHVDLLDTIFLDKLTAI